MERSWSSGGPSTGSRCSGWRRSPGRAEQRGPTGRCFMGGGGDCCLPAHGGGWGAGHFSGPSHHGWLGAGPLRPSLSVAREENKHRSPRGRHRREGHDGQGPAGELLSARGSPQVDGRPWRQGRHPKLARAGQPGRPALSCVTRGSPTSLDGSSWEGILLQGPEA